mmetsp:Transcript_26052/g.39852  ORF Transcript_26052/g.39852 Transcript_26052/m.39852 type:complete len:275 (+) Transcript_26052:233-1057(+)
MEYHAPGDYGVTQMRRQRQYRRPSSLYQKQDTFDHDPETVSVYDGMKIDPPRVRTFWNDQYFEGAQVHSGKHHHKHHHQQREAAPLSRHRMTTQEEKLQIGTDSISAADLEAFTVNAMKESSELYRQAEKYTKQKQQHKSKGKDAFDLDHNTASEFDDASNINNGNPYFKHLPNDTPIAESEADLKKKIKKDIETKEAEKAKKDGKIPDPAPDTKEQGDAKAAAKSDSDKAFGDAAPKKEEEAKAIGENVDEASIKEKKPDGSDKPDGEEKKEA